MYRRRRKRWDIWAEPVRHSLDPLRPLSLTLLLLTSDPLSSRTQGLVLQLNLLQERLATLLETPSPPTQGPPPTEAEPWTSRAAFVNWAASAKVDALPAVPRESGSGTASEDVVITQLQESMERTGKQEDATVSAMRPRGLRRSRADLSRTIQSLLDSL